MTPNAFAARYIKARCNNKLMLPQKQVLGERRSRCKQPLIFLLNSVRFSTTTTILLLYPRLFQWPAKVFKFNNSLLLLLLLSTSQEQNTGKIHLGRPTLFRAAAVVALLLLLASGPSIGPRGGCYASRRLAQVSTTMRKRPLS